MRLALIAVATTLVVFVALVVGLCMLLTEEAEHASSQTYESPAGWSVVVDRKDGWMYSDFRVRLQRTVALTREAQDSVTLVPWGYAFVTDVEWLDETTVRIEGSLGRRDGAYLQSWENVSIQYDLR